MKITVLKLAKAIALTDKDYMTQKLKHRDFIRLPFYKKLQYVEEAERILKALKWLKENENKKDTRN